MRVICELLESKEHECEQAANGMSTHRLGHNKKDLVISYHAAYLISIFVYGKITPRLCMLLLESLWVLRLMMQLVVAPLHGSLLLHFCTITLELF